MYGLLLMALLVVTYVEFFFFSFCLCGLRSFAVIFFSRKGINWDVLSLLHVWDDF